MKKALLGLTAFIGIALCVFWFVVPWQVDKGRNGVLQPPPYAASEAARALHARLRIADLHADTLLWDRDLLDRATYGHVDVPRLLDGNVGIQAFTVVTKTPRGMNIERNTGDSDNITLLAMAERWPIATWTNLTERALYQARRLHDAARRSNGDLVILQNRDDLDRFLARRQSNRRMVAGFLGLEGAHALSGDLSNLDRLYEAGFRMIGLAHFFDTDVSGSAHGVDQGGLTDQGRRLIARIEQTHMFVDLAHASSRTIADVLVIARRPVVVSHTGVKGACDNARNLSDDQLKGIAATGGLVGIGYWQTATCGTDAAAIARSIRYAVGVIGADHVALGSDFDGAVVAPFETTGVIQITDALLQAGFDETTIRKVMGENVIRLLETLLK
jgi:microsomal dipeptidase-like Zn-dependent dipeptidase